jgi:hypothetical protein
MTFDPHAYTITTRKRVHDGETIYKATVAELPHLATYEDTWEAAYASIVEDIEALHAMAVQNGHPFPPPMSEPAECTGRVTLRLPRTLHHRLAEQSLRDDVSLNTCIVALLAEALSANSVASAMVLSMQRQLREMLGTTDLLHQAGAHGPSTAYSTTSQKSIVEKDETWTPLH